MPLTPGTRLGPYEILGPLDAGGMGQVYRARDTKLGREVAVKVLRDDYARNADWLGRFEREARLLAALNHANIATVHGLDEVDGVRYLVMELVPGQTLAARIRSGPLPLGEALGICRQIAEALETAHERGILHRDLKPANVVVTPDGKAKVLDFGLAKSMEPAPEAAAPTETYAPPTVPGRVMGTLAYMPPEQAHGKQLDRRCDIWALGCILYETLTGKRAFSGVTPRDPAPPDWGALSAAPRRVVGLVRRCLQKDVRRRLRDAGDARLEIEEELAELAELESARAAPQSLVEAPPPRRSRRLLLVAIAVAAVFALGMLAQGLRQEKPPAWSGEFLLGGTTRAFGPRLSPDGKSLAFLVIEKGQAQVGVMDLRNGHWRVVTESRDRGAPLGGVCWSATGDMLYFDRFYDRPYGVYSVSPTAKKVMERRVLKDAECPQVAFNDSLVVSKLDEKGYYHLWRQWLDQPGREVKVSPPIEFSRGWPSPVRALRTKPQVVFCGILLDDKEPAPKRGFYLLDLESKKLRRLPVGDTAVDFVQLALSPDDRYGYTILPAGNAFRVVRFPLEGDGPVQPLLTLTTPAFGLDVDADGRVYLDQFQRPLEILRFGAEGGRPERIASTTSLGWGTVDRVLQPVELPEGRVLLPSKVSGRDRLLVVEPGKDPVPLLAQERGEAGLPAVLLDDRRLALMAGSAANRRLTIAELEGDHAQPGRTFKSVPNSGLEGLTVSLDCKTLYYVHTRKLWRVPVDEGREAEAFERGDGVALFPKKGDMLIQRYEKDGVRLFRRPEEGPPSETSEIKVKPGPLRLVPAPVFGRAIDRDGRVLVTATSKDTYFWKVALLDSNSGEITEIPLDFEGDTLLANWGSKGRVLAMGFTYKAELWQLTPQK